MTAVFLDKKKKKTVCLQFFTGDIFFLHSCKFFTLKDRDMSVPLRFLLAVFLASHWR